MGGIGTLALLWGPLLGSLLSLPCLGTRGIWALTARQLPPSVLLACHLCPTSQQAVFVLRLQPFVPVPFPSHRRPGPLSHPCPSDCVFSSSSVTSALHSILGEEGRGGGRGPRWGGGPRLRQPPATKSSVPGTGRS